MITLEYVHHFPCLFPISRQFPEHSEFVGAATSISTNAGSNPSLDFTANLEQPPEEVMELAHRQLRQNLAQELLERIKIASPAARRRLVIELRQDGLWRFAGGCRDGNWQDWR
jgi:restriction endonuclease Mrr